MHANIATEKHVFKDVESYFADKIHSFHDKYSDCFLLIGIDAPNTPLDEVKMTKNPEYPLLYYQRIVGGIMSSSPLITIKSFSKDNLSSHCAIYYLNNDQDIEDFFFTQNVCRWENTNQTCFQVWRLKYLSVFDMNDHWL